MIPLLSRLTLLEPTVQTLIPPKSFYLKEERKMAAQKEEARDDRRVRLFYFLLYRFFGDGDPERGPEMDTAQWILSELPEMTTLLVERGLAHDVPIQVNYYLHMINHRNFIDG